MPNSFIDNVTPKFQIIKKRFNKIVILIDKSLKSKNSHDLTKIKAGINDYIKHMVNDNDLIGVIHFENFAEIVVSMTLTRDQQTRQSIYERIIPKTSLNTKNSNIYNALSLGVILMQSTQDKKHVQLEPSGGKIILITNSKADMNYPNREFIVNDVNK